MPKSEALRTGTLAIPERVVVVTNRLTDPSAVTVVRQALLGAGAASVRITASARLVSQPGLAVYVGRNAQAERALHVSDASRLVAGGYVLAAGLAAKRPIIVLDGADSAGQFYAGQTLRQLLAHRRGLRSVVIRDWPSFPSRGVVEGFYGTPWSLQARLSILDFLGAHKLNLYVYSPKDDPLLRSQWRTPYSPADLRTLQTLVDRAAQNHVTFNFAVSPGLSICYSAPDDETALIQKLSSVWALGVRSFTIAFDDIDPTRPACASDQARFGTGDTALASAQAYLLNEIDHDFIGAHAGARPLTAVPTEYSGTASSPYQQTLARSLDSTVVIQWTGPYGVSTSITSADAATAAQLYGHAVLLWDNWFVNDYAPGQLVLGAFDGHDRALPSTTVGIAADPMDQPESSKIGLFTVADYAWNPEAYDPSRSWTAGLSEFAAGDATAVSALRYFADANYAPPVNSLHAPVLMAALDTFWRKWYAQPSDASAASQLDATLQRLRDAPAVIRQRIHDPAFIAEAGPWLDAASLWSQAAIAGVDLLVARRAGNDAQAAAAEQLTRTLRAQAQLITWSGTTPPTPVQIAGDALSSFVHYALRGYGP